MAYFVSIYKKHKFFLFVRWNSAKIKKDIIDRIFGKRVHLSSSWMLKLSEFQLSSFLVHRKKFTKKFEIFFFPQHANELNIPNMLKYASNRINSFIYLNKLYYIIESIILQCYIVETFQQNSSLQNMALHLPQLANSFVGF